LCLMMVLKQGDCGRVWYQGSAEQPQAAAGLPSPRELMAYLGLVPSEHSTGDSVKRGAITKTGNSRARRTLVESAWGYRHPARVSANKQRFVERAPRRVRARLPGRRK
jgi:transposase